MTLDALLSGIEKRCEISHTIYCDIKDIKKLIQAGRVLSEALEELSHDTDYPWGETHARKALQKASEVLE